MAAGREDHLRAPPPGGPDVPTQVPQECILSPAVPELQACHYPLPGVSSGVETTPPPQPGVARRLSAGPPVRRTGLREPVGTTSYLPEYGRRWVPTQDRMSHTQAGLARGSTSSWFIRSCAGTSHQGVMSLALRHSTASARIRRCVRAKDSVPGTLKETRHKSLKADGSPLTPR